MRRQLDSKNHFQFLPVPVLTRSSFQQLIRRYFRAFVVSTQLPRDVLTNVADSSGYAQRKWIQWESRSGRFESAHTRIRLVCDRRAAHCVSAIAPPPRRRPRAGARRAPPPKQYTRRLSRLTSPVRVAEQRVAQYTTIYSAICTVCACAQAEAEAEAELELQRGRESRTEQRAASTRPIMTP